MNKLLSKAKIPPVLILAIYIHFLFWLTYGPTTAMDAKNYQRMMINGESNLIHASGYPFIFHFFILIFQILLKPFFWLSELTLLYLITFVQHALTIISYVLFYKVIKRIFSPFTASLTILLLISNWTALGFTSITYPEWFQSKMLILVFCLTHFAYSQKHFIKKLLLYSLGLLFFTISFLAKFNILFWLIPLSAPFFVDKSTVKKKLIICIVSILLSFSFLLTFLFTYHYPSTGTFALTYDKAWIFSDKIGYFFDGQLIPKKTGIESKRLLFISELLPSGADEKKLPLYDFPNINFAPLEIRGKYKQEYFKILSLTEEDLDKQISYHDQKDVYTAWNSIGYYVGLKEANDLLTKVYLEIIHKYPLTIMSKVFSDTYHNLTHLDYYYRPFPIEIYKAKQSEEGYGFFENKQTNCGSYFIIVKPEKYGWVSLDQTCPFIYRNFGNQYQTYIWIPGSFIFSAFFIIGSKIPQLFWLILVILGMTLSIKQYILKKLSRFTLLFHLSLTASILIFILFSNTLYFFRFDKEYQQIIPAIALLVSLSLTRVISELAYFRKVIKK